MNKSFLLCPPEYYGTHFLFNPWMTYSDEVDREKAAMQWRNLCRSLERHASLEFLEPDPNLSAMVFTRDNALVYAPRKALTLRSFGPRGKGEPKRVGSWFRKRKYLVSAVPDGMFLEGGNLLYLGSDTWAAGWKQGDSLEVYRWFAEFLRRETGRQARIVLVKLVNLKYLHLDMVVSPLDGRGFLVYPEGLNLGADWRNSSLWGGKPVITIDREEAERFGANAVVVGNTVITGGLSDETTARIEALGFEVERVDLSEFHKAGGCSHCLTLDLQPPV